MHGLKFCVNKLHNVHKAFHEYFAVAISTEYSNTKNYYSFEPYIVNTSYSDLLVIHSTYMYGY